MAGNDADPALASEYLQVQTTTDSRAEAMELAAGAVRARLAACGQVAGPVASTYWWNDEIERAEEWFVFFKLPADRYADLAAFIAGHHSYDEPEIVATPLVAGSPTFLSWLVEETRAGVPRPRESGVASPSDISGLPLRLGRDVPRQDDGLVMLEAERRDGAGVQPEQASVGRRES
jgi:periplasmic divalent cation tolerance protein